MNLADAIRKAAVESGDHSPAPTHQPVGNQQVELKLAQTQTEGGHTMADTHHYEHGDGEFPHPTVSNGNVVRLELFLTAEQMNGMLRAIMAGQHTVLTLREAAAYLRVNPSTLEKLAEDGEVPGVLLEGRWRFPKPNLDEWLQFRSTPAEDSENVA